MVPRLLAALAAAILTAAPTPSLALNCTSGPLSSCIDGNQQWLTPSGPFLALPSTRMIAHGEAVFALATVYQYRPLVLVAPSPTNAGREIALVEHSFDSQSLIQVGLGHDLNFHAALRWVPQQRGTGIGAARSRVDSELPTTAIRDPLLGLGYAATQGQLLGGSYHLELRGVVSLPLGDANAFAGERTLVGAPDATFSWAVGSLTLAAALGARLRGGVTLADTRYGHQLTSGLGVAVELLPQTLFLAAEASAAPGLAGGALEANHVPAEWALTVSTSCSDWLDVSLGGGGGLPLSSSRTVSESDETTLSRFSGLGVPAMRMVLMLSAHSASQAQLASRTRGTEAGHEAR